MNLCLASLGPQGTWLTCARCGQLFESVPEGDTIPLMCRACRRSGVGRATITLPAGGAGVSRKRLASPGSGLPVKDGFPVATSYRIEGARDTHIGGANGTP